MFITLRNKLFTVLCHIIVSVRAFRSPIFSEKKIWMGALIFYLIVNLIKLK